MVFMIKLPPTIKYLYIMNENQILIEKAKQLVQEIKEIIINNIKTSQKNNQKRN